MPRTLWLDCDPGLDDWLTLLLLARQPNLHLAGVSIVAGNAPLEITLDNALRIRALHGLQVPIHAGASQPLGRNTITAQNVLGLQGMRTTGTALASAAQAAAMPADSADGVAALLTHVREAATRTTLVAIGPLTNVALAIQRDPVAMQSLQEIVIMGGSTDRGNHTPAAEFNIYADPEAADIAFRSGIPIRMFGLNVCRQVLLKREHVQAVQSWSQRTTSQPAHLADSVAVLSGYVDAYQRIRSADGSAPMPLYEPVVALWLLAPELFEFQAAPVDIELVGQHTRGMTVCDLRNRDNRACNVQIALHAQGDDLIKRFMIELKKSLTYFQ
jgi:purine nucleosidase